MAVIILYSAYILANIGLIVVRFNTQHSMPNFALNIFLIILEVFRSLIIFGLIDARLKAKKGGLRASDKEWFSVILRIMFCITLIGLVPAFWWWSEATILYRASVEVTLADILLFIVMVPIHMIECGALILPLLFMLTSEIVLTLFLRKFVDDVSSNKWTEKGIGASTTGIILSIMFMLGLFCYQSRPFDALNIALGEIIAIAIVLLLKTALLIIFICWAITIKPSAEELREIERRDREEETLRQRTLAQSKLAPQNENQILLDVLYRTEHMKAKKIALIVIMSISGLFFLWTIVVCLIQHYTIYDVQTFLVAFLTPLIVCIVLYNKVVAGKRDTMVVIFDDETNTYRQITNKIKSEMSCPISAITGVEYISNYRCLIIHAPFGISTESAMKLTGWTGKDEALLNMFRARNIPVNIGMA